MKGICGYHRLYTGASFSAFNKKNTFESDTPLAAQLYMCVRVRVYTEQKGGEELWAVVTT